MILDSEVSNYIHIAGKRYSNFSGNDYLGLSSHPLVKKAAADAIEAFGLNTSASRQTTGTTKAHLELERELADFKEKEDAVVFASGYMGNQMLLRALGNSYDAVFVDEFAHPSILDGIPVFLRQIHAYKHCDPTNLEDLLEKHKDKKPLVVSDGIFPLTGAVAPLGDMYLLVKKYGATLVVDDAHATGVLGEKGTGTPEFFRLHREEDIYQTDTMSKAFGVYGGYISAGRRIINRVRKESTIYQASTALPPPLVAAAYASTRILRQTPGLRQTLLRNARDLRTKLLELDFQTTQGPAPIIPIFFSSPEKARSLSEYLKDHGIIVPFISYPVNMDRFIARITVTANHTADQIAEFLMYLKQWRSAHGVT